MNYNYRSILLFIWILIGQCLPGQAQQLPLFNQDRAHLNPAYISSGYFKYNAPTNISLRYRYQWSKLKGAPKTFLGSFSHFDEATRFSFGGNLISDKTGPTGFTGVYGSAGYGIQLSKDLLLSFGLRGGATQYRVRGNELEFLTPGDLANNNVTVIYPDFSFGTMLYWQEHYYIGFSVPQIFSLNLAFKDNTDEYKIERVRHYYGIVGARFDVGDDSWLEGSVEGKYVENVPFYVNSKIEFEFRQIFWIELNGSTAREFGLGLGGIAIVGNNSNLIKFGYTFSNFFQSYGSQFGNVHEVGVQFYL